MRRILKYLLSLSLWLWLATLPVQAANPTLYWGAYINGSIYGLGNAPWDQNAWNTFEADAGHKSISILHWGEPWHWTGQTGYSGIGDGFFQKFFPGDFTTVRTRGAIPLIDWSSADLTTSPYNSQSVYSLTNITNGMYDNYLRQWASGAAAWNHPLFLRFDWEMNGNWYPWSELQTTYNAPGQFAAMWRHVHDIFTSVGANNVSWVWCPNIDFSGETAMSELYPGDNYVDWICLDGYNKGTASQSFSTIYTNSYQTITQIAPTKPLLIGEFASNEFAAGVKASWITDAITTQIPTNFPKIKAILWFNWNADAGSSFVIESSTSSQTAFANAISSSVYANSEFANLINTKIQPLTISFLALISTWFITPASLPQDQNSDNLVNSFDFAILHQ